MCGPTVRKDLNLIVNQDHYLIQPPGEDEETSNWGKNRSPIKISQFPIKKDKDGNTLADPKYFIEQDGLTSFQRQAFEDLSLMGEKIVRWEPLPIAMETPPHEEVYRFYLEVLRTFSSLDQRKMANELHLKTGVRARDIAKLAQLASQVRVQSFIEEHNIKKTKYNFDEVLQQGKVTVDDLQNYARLISVDINTIKGLRQVAKDHQVNPDDVIAATLTEVLAIIASENGICLSKMPEPVKTWHFEKGEEVDFSKAPNVDQPARPTWSSLLYRAYEMWNKLAGEIDPQFQAGLEVYGTGLNYRVSVKPTVIGRVDSVYQDHVPFDIDLEGRIYGTRFAWLVKQALSLCLQEEEEVQIPVTFKLTKQHKAICLLDQEGNSRLNPDGEPWGYYQPGQTIKFPNRASYLRWKLNQAFFVRWASGNWSPRKGFGEEKPWTEIYPKHYSGTLQLLRFAENNECPDAKDGSCQNCPFEMVGLACKEERVENMIISTLEEIDQERLNYERQETQQIVSEYKPKDTEVWLTETIRKIKKDYPGKEILKQMVKVKVDGDEKVMTLLGAIRFRLYRRLQKKSWREKQVCWGKLDAYQTLVGWKRRSKET